MAFKDVSGDTSGLNLSERLLLNLQKFELDPEKMRSQMLRWCRYCVIIFNHKAVLVLFKWKDKELT